MKKTTDILDKAQNGVKLNHDEVIFLLSQREEATLNRIYEAARNTRTEYFGNKIFAYGFVYFSTYCHNECSFCFYRKSNDQSLRYRKNRDEIVDLSKALAASGVHLIDLTMGEDAVFLEDEERLIELVDAVKAATGLALMISPGKVSEPLLDKLIKSGVDWYALYQETYNRQLYRKMRLDQDYDQRMSTKIQARDKGFLLEEGLLTGIGDTIEDRAQAMLAMGSLGVSQVRTMTFVPQKGTPLENVTPQDCGNELLNISVMRLLYPDKLIPASLDVEGLSGLQGRLMAGANVITSIIPPREGLAGVSQSSLDIDDGSRSLPMIIPTLEAAGLTLATNADYENFLKKEKIKRGA
ncbi:methylornithine synthase PylB [Acetobacterium sp.]|uniref:methylornithine synthase PylB n=1 Tax=Acetobacterium sp. TaxID=1872094 RepID=UPI0035930CAB